VHTKEEENQMTDRYPAVGDRVRVKDEMTEAFGLKPGTEGTVTFVGILPHTPNIQAVLFQQIMPVEVQWDGEDYTSHFYQLGGRQSYDRVKPEEVEVVE
jgi:hypothetical protein